MERMLELTLELLADEEEAALKAIGEAILKLRKSYSRGVMGSLVLAGFVLFLLLPLGAELIPRMDFALFAFILAGTVLGSAVLLEFAWFGRRRCRLGAELERIAASPHAQSAARKVRSAATALYAFRRVDALARELERPGLVTRGHMRELFPTGGQDD